MSNLSLSTYKSTYLSKKCQFILFDNQGVILESCDTLLLVSNHSGQSIYSVFSFLESLQEVILSLNHGDSNNFRIPRVDFNFGADSFIFDFIIEYRKDLEKFLCILENNNVEHAYISQLQQYGKESVIEKEILEIQNKNILLEKELLFIQNKELERMQAFKSRFFSDMSHELRTPLNGILGLVEMLYEEPAHLDRYLDTIQKTSKHLLSIVDDVLDLSKIEAGKLVLNETVFDLKELIERVFLNFIFQSRAKNIKLVFDYDETNEYLFWGDSIRISQIFFNVIGNAIKFTDEGKIVIKLKTETLDKDYIDVKCSIEDTGIGIPEDKIQEIFERFIQVGDDGTHKYSGTGLGLSIVKYLIEIYKGEISVLSQINKGTNFQFNLILKKAASYEFISKTQEQNNETLKKFNSNPSILLADDDQIAILYSKKLLENWNCNVKVANNGKEVVDLLLDKAFDLVLLDIQMPIMNGYETIKYIRENLKLSSEILPIVCLTAGYVFEEMAKDELYKPDYYLSKPYNKKAFNELLHQIFSAKNIH